MFFDDLFNDYDPFNAYSYRQSRPQTSTLFRNDNRSIILRKLLNDEYNYICFDCHREINDLDYFDLKNGIFLCYNCAQQHAKLPKEISQPMTGNIRSLEEKDLLILYYGGNQNLFEFIRRHYPLLENMNINNMYSTKAMDYYRKLLRSKAYDEQEPEMPGKKSAYNSIFQKKINPTRENKNHKNIRDYRTNENLDRDEERDRDIFSSTFFGDDLFNRNKRNQREKERKEEEDAYFGAEPADIKKENEENLKDDAGMKVEKINHNKKVKNEKKNREPKTERKINHHPKQKKFENKQKIVEEKKYDNTPNTLNINQIGELSMYPDAMEINGMDCE